MKKIFIIVCNPKKESFSDAILQSYISGAEKSNNKIRHINVYNLEVEYYNFNNDLTDELKQFQANIFWADELVFIYPVWCLSIPAKLKSIIERTFQINGEPIRDLKGKTAVIIQTYGMPVFIMKYFMGDLPFKLMQGLFRFCAIKVKKRFDFGQVANLPQEKHTKWLKKIENYASR